MIPNNKVFCMAPFVHTYVEPTGHVRPCCVAQGEEFGNIQQDSIENIWNNEKYKTIRLNMIADKPSVECKRCMTEESWSNQSMRISMNELYSDKIELVDSMLVDGELPHMNLLRWDFRFSNLCNLACIGCSSEYSSTWSDLAKQMYNVEQPIFLHNKNYMQQFLDAVFNSSMDSVKQIYFAGGEPLIQWEHYEVLQQLYDHGNLDSIEFSYSTNLTSLSYKGKSILDYWTKMKKIFVCVSMDEIDEDRLYYIRYPSLLSKLLPNLKLLKESLCTDSQTYTITPTWSMLNTHRIKEYMEFLLNNDLLPNAFYMNSRWEHDFHLIIMLDPDRLSVGASNPEWKIHLHEKINEYETWYKTVLIPLKHSHAQKQSIEVLEQNMKRFHSAIDRPVNYDYIQWKDWISRLDTARKTDWATTFPELEWHLDKHY
jgi:radical SAM protein with 4Fe4S-binding SPASM domain